MKSSSSICLPFHRLEQEALLPDRRQVRSPGDKNHGMLPRTGVFPGELAARNTRPPSETTTATLMIPPFPGSRVIVISLHGLTAPGAIINH